MPESLYDAHADFYDEFINRGLQQASSHFNLALQAIWEALGDVDGLGVLDLACGEGHLSRQLAQRGATVTGLDLSKELLARARDKDDASGTVYMEGDARNLEGLEDATFDAVVCNLALMDIPDPAAVFSSVAKVLNPGGLFVFNVLHPCFETPFSLPESTIESGALGEFVACRVSRYADEGHWTSGGDGVRGTLGAHHRTLSTYLNALIDAGFHLTRVDEPMLPAGEYDAPDEQRLSRVPVSLVVAARK